MERQSAYECFPTIRTSWRFAFVRMRSCAWPRSVDLIARQLPTSNAAVQFDAKGAAYSAMRRWRDGATESRLRRDSVAGALEAAGARHIACPDSVQHPDGVSTRWLSRWRGPAFEALLFHYAQDDSITVQLQVARLHAFPDCYLSLTQDQRPHQLKIKFEVQH